MQVAKWGNSLAVRLPKELTEKLGLKAGDNMEFRLSGERELTLHRKLTREEALKRLQDTRLKLPPGYKFNREELYER